MSETLDHADLLARFRTAIHEYDFALIGGDADVLAAAEARLMSLLDGDDDDEPILAVRWGDSIIIRSDLSAYDHWPEGGPLRLIPHDRTLVVPPAAV